MFAVLITLALIGFVGLVAAIGVCHRRYNLLVKVFPRTVSPADNLNECETINSHQERMQEFRLL
jgi:hypothetical protein